MSDRSDFLTQTRIAIVKKCTFSSSWNNPNGGQVHYHLLELDNGDSGTCGRQKINPDDMREGCEIEYSVTNGKIKFVRNTGLNANSYKMNKPTNKNNFKGGGGRPKATLDSFLGYSYAYAKDLVVAGKTTKKDIENLRQIAETIYSHIEELLKKGEQQDEQQKLM